MNPDRIASADLPSIRHLTVRTVAVPLSTPLRTASGVMPVAPMVLFDLATTAGSVGRAYIFTYNPVVLAAAGRLAEDIARLVEGQPLEPRALMATLRRRFTLMGSPGLVDMVLAGIDMAAWDAWARFLGQPLVRVLGGSFSFGVRAYASYGMDGLEQTVRNVATAREAGFDAVKIKIGYPSLSEDLDAVRAARREGGPDLRLMVDYNQSLGTAEAVRRCSALDGEGLEWIEEPIAYDDNRGHAQVADAIVTPLQLGENLYGARQVAASLRDGASDLMMPDLMKIGGVTGWLDAVALCTAQGMPVSNHFYQEVSVHALAVTPTAHFLEHFAMADPLLRSPLRIERGMATCPDAPGNGIEWREDSVERYRT